MRTCRHIVYFLVPWLLLIHIHVKADTFWQVEGVNHSLMTGVDYQQASGHHNTPPPKGHFKPLTPTNDIFVVKPETTYWFRVLLTNNSSDNEFLRLVVPGKSVDELDIVLDDDTRFELGHRRYIQDFGQALLPAAAVHLAPNSSKVIHIRAYSNVLGFMSLSQMSETDYRLRVQKQILFWGSVCGMMGIFAVYCLCLWVVNRTALYVYFSAYLATTLVMTLKSVGLMSALISPLIDSLLFDYHGLFSSVISIIVLCFVGEFISVCEKSGGLSKKLYGFILIFLIVGLASMALGQSWQFIVSEVELLGVLLIISLVGIYLVNKPGAWIKVFFAGWLPPMAFLILLISLSAYPQKAALYLPHIFAVAVVTNTVFIWLAMGMRTQALERRHSYSLSHDLDTELPKMPLLLQRAREMIAKDCDYSVILFKPQDFAGARAIFGIEHVNAYLKKVINVLNVQLAGMNLTAIETRSSGPDYICRLNDDTFGLLANGKLELSQLEQFVCIINSTFVEGVELNDTHLVDQVEVGVANFPLHGDNEKQLLERAMLALYTKKRYGEKWHIFTPDDSLNSQRRLNMVSELKQALKRGQFLLYFQPQVELAANRVFGAEVLLRWEHPEMGFIPPDQFIPIAESAGLIFEITEWVLEQSLRYQRTLQKIHPGHTISINISGRDLSNRDLPVLLLTLINELAVAPSSVVIELTESATVLNQQQAQESLDDLKSIGVKIAIDDFGTGYSSLSYVSQLGVDEIKIDKQFVMNIAHSMNDQTICRATCDMARSIGVIAVAEGIESESDVAYLKSYGCDVGQGYYFAKPMTFEDYQQWLTDTPQFSQGKVEVLQRFT